jgi:hypothetical protein
MHSFASRISIRVGQQNPVDLQSGFDDLQSGLGSGSGYDAQGMGSGYGYDAQGMGSGYGYDVQGMGSGYGYDVQGNPRG